MGATNWCAPSRRSPSKRVMNRSTSFFSRISTRLAALAIAGACLGPSVANATDIYTCEDDCWDDLVADKLACQDGPGNLDACWDRADDDYETCIDICNLIYPYGDPTQVDCDFWDWYCDPFAY